MLVTSDLKFIFYNKKTLSVYDVIPVNFEFRGDPPIHYWSLDWVGPPDEVPYINLKMKTDGVKKKAEFSPELMKLIAKYNLERENEHLIREIAANEAKLRQLHEKIEREQKRIDDLKSIVAEFVTGDYDTLADMFSEYKDF